MLSFKPQLAHCYLGLAKLYLKGNKRDKARDEVKTAINLFKEMNMEYWVEQGSELLDLIK